MDGTPLRTNRSLQDQGVLDGTRLWLRFVEDDEARIPVIEHVTSAIPAELRKRWPSVTPAWAARVAMTLVSVGVLAALGLLARWRNEHHGWLAAAVGLSIAVGLLAAATVIMLRPDTSTDLAQPALSRGRTFRLVADVLRLNGIAALAVGLGAAVPGPLGAPHVALATAVILAAAALNLRFFGGPLALCTAVIVIGVAALLTGLARMVLLTSATTLLCCVLLVVTLYSGKAHNLAFLRKKAEAINARLAEAWPRETKFERRCFELLREAYVKARYSKHYKISAEELTWLTQRVEVLRALATAVCAERLAHLREAASHDPAA